MIGVAVHGKVSGIVTSLPIVGGITASGVFLVFIIQFSCSCAALSVNVADQQRIISTAWYASESYSPELVIKAEQTFDCCGSGIEKVNRTTYDKPTMKDHRGSIEHNVFKEGDACYTARQMAPSSIPASHATRKFNQRFKVDLMQQEVLDCSSHFRSLSECGLPPGLETKKILESTQVLFSRNLNSHYLLFGALVACRYRNLMDPFGAAGVGLAK